MTGRSERKPQLRHATLLPSIVNTHIVCGPHHILVLRLRVDDVINELLDLDIRARSSYRRRIQHLRTRREFQIQPSSHRSGRVRQMEILLFLRWLIAIAPVECQGDHQASPRPRAPVKGSSHYPESALAHLVLLLESPSELVGWGLRHRPLMTCRIAELVAIGRGEVIQYRRTSGAYPCHQYTGD